MVIHQIFILKYYIFNIDIINYFDNLIKKGCAYHGEFFQNYYIICSCIIIS